MKDNNVSIEKRDRRASVLTWEIGKRKHEESRARSKDTENRATYDDLTGLLNKHSFGLILENRLHSLPRKAEHLADDQAETEEDGVAILFLDMTGFKRFNDEYGHEFGDVILKQTATALEGSVRRGDTVARWGGDEFILLLEDVKNKQLEDEVDEQGVVVKKGLQRVIMEHVNEKMRAQIGKLCEEGEMEWEKIGRKIPLEEFEFFACGASFVGAKEYRDSGKSDMEWVKDLTDISDMAMYLDKKDVNKAMEVNGRS